MDKYNNLSGLGLDELKQLVEEYPWFSGAREALFYKIVEIEPECLENEFRNNLIFFPCRDMVFYKAKRIAYEITNNIIDFSDIEKEDISIPEALDGEIEDESNINNRENKDEREEIEFSGSCLKKEYIIVGGDYFSNEDFKELEESESIKDFKLTPFREEGKECINDAKEAKFNEESPEFYTETLAKIYADQEYYKEAIDIYAKLILLYPEKSAYFAASVEKIKLKIK